MDWEDSVYQLKNISANQHNRSSSVSCEFLKVIITGRGLSFCIIASRFNDKYVNQLLDGALRVLSKAGVEETNIQVMRVPGAWEIPLAVQKMTKYCDAVIALGCVIRGKTSHFENVVRGCSDGLMRVSLDTNTPITHAILSVESEEDAQGRCSGKVNRGEEAANAALEMVNLLNQSSE